MADYKVNERCIIGLPSCGYGFSSSRMCFIARPADGEFQLEEDILTQLLTERNYETYVALQRIDPGNFAFCTKICSKIITSQFCIVILNQSMHLENPNIKIPNPNVYFEYGMMKSLHKHVIPIQRDEEPLPFNIFPIDTIKYKPENFKNKAENAIDDAILRIATKEHLGRPIGAASEVIKFLAFRGLKYSDISTDQTTKAIFNLGAQYGFNLFDGDNEIVFFGYFHEEEPREIVIRIKFLLNNINIAYKRMQENPDISAQDIARRLLTRLKIEVLIPETANVSAMTLKIDEFQNNIFQIPVLLHTSKEIETFVKEQYEGIGF